MPGFIEDYAVIGNCETVALVGRDGSVGWLGFPRFDSAACFRALLGDPRNGRWLIGPIAGGARTTRHYRGDTLILETTFETETGAACVIDFMSRRDGVSDVVRIVRGMHGTVAMHTELIVRFDYGSVMPWVSREDDGRLQFIAGPDRLLLDTTVSLRGLDFRTVGEFNIKEKDEVCFTLSRALSYGSTPAPFHAIDALAEADDFWSNWAKQFDATGEWSAAVLRSLLTLKALSHRETGGIIAADQWLGALNTSIFSDKVSAIVGQEMAPCIGREHYRTLGHR